jgi:type VI secretion system protein ImpK
MERVTEVTKDCFDAVMQLRQAEAAAIPPPEQVHHRLRGTVDDMLRRASVMGFSHQDAQDMAYALVALMDELMLGKPETYRQFWMGHLLQLQYFGENMAGDNFFVRLEVIRKDPHRIEALQIYYLCLLFGFQGRYRIRGGELELMTLIDTLQKELERVRPFDFETLSPHGERPDEKERTSSGRLSLFTISMATLGLAFLVYGGLFIGLASTTTTLLHEVQLHVAQVREAR